MYMSLFYRFFPFSRLWAMLPEIKCLIDYDSKKLTSDDPVDSIAYCVAAAGNSCPEFIFITTKT